VLKVLTCAGILVDFIAGSGMGAVVGWAFAAGMTAKGLHRKADGGGHNHHKAACQSYKVISVL
jgi:membrane protein YqaA with SNARE-associated domain